MKKAYLIRQGLEEFAAAREQFGVLVETPLSEAARLVLRPGDNCGCRAPHRPPGKAPSAANGQPLARAGHSGWSG